MDDRVSPQNPPGSATSTSPSSTKATLSEAPDLPVDAAPTPSPAAAPTLAPDTGPMPVIEPSAADGPGGIDGLRDVSSSLDHNPYGLLALWEQGDLVIKAVAVILLLMSVLSWYLIASRGLRALRLSRAARRTRRFWHAERFDEGLERLGKNRRDNPFRLLAEEGVHARDHHAARRQELHGQLGLADWLTASLRAAIDGSAERMQSGLAVLASIGSTAPFIGLFGTVWGIYHALVRIGVSGRASIDQVAGPVGEALIMTAFGLAVAIPAVLGYNVLVRANKGVISRLNGFAHQLHAYFLTGAPLRPVELRLAPTAPQAR